MDFLIAILSTLLSGVIATLITVNYYKRQELRQRKLDVLANIMHNLNGLVPPVNEQRKKDLTGYLNESYIVFYDNLDILNQLETMKNSMNDSKFTKLIKLMCKDLKIDYSNVSDEFITKPFC